MFVDVLMLEIITQDMCSGVEDYTSLDLFMRCEERVEYLFVFY